MKISHDLPLITLLRRAACFYTHSLAGLRNGQTLNLGLVSPSEESATPLSIGEALAMEDLELSVLFDEREDEDHIGGELVPSDGVERG